MPVVLSAVLGIVSILVLSTVSVAIRTYFRRTYVARTAPAELYEPMILLAEPYYGNYVNTSNYIHAHED